MQEERAGERGRRGRAAATRRAAARRRGRAAAPRPPPAPRVAAQRLDQRRDRARAQLGVLVEQQAELAARLARAAACRSPPCPRGARRSISRRRSPSPRGAAFQLSTASAEPSSEALSSTSTSASSAAGCVVADRLEAGEQELAPVGVDDAVGEVHRKNRCRCASRSSIPRRSRRPTTARCARRSPPPAPTSSWSRAGSRYGPVPRREGYRVDELFYRALDRARARGAAAAAACGSPSTSRACAACAPTPRRADVVHLQWLSVPDLDRFLLPRPPAGVHGPLPAARASARARARQRGAALADGRGDRPLRARRRRAARAGRLDPTRVHRIPHGAFDHLDPPARRAAAARRSSPRSRGR